MAELVKDTAEGVTSITGAGTEVYLASEVDEVINHLKAEIERLKGGIKCIRELINESEGVTGLHANGDIAYWDELDQNGAYDNEWLTDFIKAEEQ